MAPMMHEFGWDPLDHARLGPGHRHRPPDGMRRAGHRRLLRRSGLQGRAGAVEPRLSDRRGRADGSAVITKVAGTGGAVNLQTVKEQMFYEVHDPGELHHARMWSSTSRPRELEQVGPDRVRVSRHLAASRARRPSRCRSAALKASSARTCSSMPGRARCAARELAKTDPRGALQDRGPARPRNSASTSSA